MEKNKKIEIILGLLIILTIVGIIYNEYVERMRREGFLPLAFAFTLFQVGLNNVLTMIPYGIFMLMIIFAKEAVMKFISLFFNIAKFVSTDIDWSDPAPTSSKPLLSDSGNSEVSCDN